MHRMHRAAFLPILVLALAACAAPGTGGGGGQSDDTTQPAASQPLGGSTAPSGGAPDASDDADETARVDIGVLAADPGALEGQRVALLARVDEVLVDGTAFLTSPSGTADGQFPVVVAADAPVDKEISVGSVLWLEGSSVALTEEDLQAAGVDVSADDLGAFDGEFIFVADSIADPLAAD